MADVVDIAAENARLEAAYTAAQDAYREGVDTEDAAYLKLQYHAARDALTSFRQFWRGVDAAVEMDDPTYGYAGLGPQGRRGGVLAHTADNTDTPEG